MLLCIYIDLFKSPESKNKLIESIPLRRLGSVDDVAEAALFLARSQYMHGAVSGTFNHYYYYCSNSVIKYEG